MDNLNITIFWNNYNMKCTSHFTIESNQLSYIVHSLYSENEFIAFGSVLIRKELITHVEVRDDFDTLVNINKILLKNKENKENG